MAAYRYDDCGLENVIIKNVKFIVDDSGDEVVCIPNVNGLHHAIATSILSRKSSMTGAELRFIRTESGAHSRPNLPGWCIGKRLQSVVGNVARAQ